MSEAAVSIQNVSVAFNGHRVLDHISVSVPEGGCTVFVGPNGAGKTTLLLCLLREVSYTGQIVMPEGALSRIGYVPQNLSFDTQTPVTVEDFLSMGETMRPLWFGLGRRIRKRSRQVLRRVGLEGAGSCRLGDLSGGQMRRVLLAAALLRQPKLLLLDEPAAGVDLKGEHLFWDVLENARRSDGMTVIMVSHNLPLTAHYATHVVCVHDRTAIEGAPHEVLTARNLMSIFGMPIHLYPDQCSVPQYLCPKCGAFGMEDEVDAGGPGGARFCPLSHEGVQVAGPACGFSCTCQGHVRGGQNAC